MTRDQCLACAGWCLKKQHAVLGDCRRPALAVSGREVEQAFALAEKKKAALDGSVLEWLGRSSAHASERARFRPNQRVSVSETGRWETCGSRICWGRV